jgi:oligoendopeptidase F
MGVDLEDEDFWENGLAHVETLIAEAERLADKAAAEKIARGDGAPHASS